MTPPESSWATATKRSPICVSDGTAAPELDHGLYVPSTWPGARAPHAWLKDGRSTLDLFGKGFVLLNFSGTNTSTITDAGKRVGVPLEVVNIDEPKAREIYERDLVLVRPDGHVAWRGHVVPSNAAEVIDKVRGVM